MSKATVTRFAPSPTGFLHIGGARTALFNWLYAKNKKGKFLLRIEDTDAARSTIEATSQILKGLEWLNLDWDGDAISQRKNIDRHQDIVEQLLKKDLAYRCYATQEDILDFQLNAKQNGTSTVFRSPWRNNTLISDNKRNNVIRLRSPEHGKTQIIDKIKGKVTWKNDTLDDLVLLRADGTPTYMLAVVVDDHDMLVSHVIRGDDHLTNTARQILIYDAMSWSVPEFAHMPLIHGADGSKLSKRHGAIGVSEYKKMGYPSLAFKNYLTRLGWSYGNQEYFSTTEAINRFSLEKVGKSPARFDKKKLDSISKYYLSSMDTKDLTQNLVSFASTDGKNFINKTDVLTLKKNIAMLRNRSKTYLEIIENATFLFTKRPIKINPNDQNLLSHDALKMLERLTLELANVTWQTSNIETLLSTFVENQQVKFQVVAQPLRIALIGQKSSPNIAEVMHILGREETVNRISDVL